MMTFCTVALHNRPVSCPQIKFFYFINKFNESNLKQLHYAYCVYLCWLNIHTDIICCINFVLLLLLTMSQMRGTMRPVHNHLLNVYWIKDYIELELKGMKDAFCARARKVQIPLKKWGRKNCYKKQNKIVFHLFAFWRLKEIEEL